MVFSNLQSHEKDAFFSLLDEYFSSRPDVFGHATSQGSDEATAGGAAASAVHRALASNPEATSRLISAGLTHGVPKSSPYAAATSNPEFNNALGRVAASSLAFSSPKGSAPVPPQRTSNTYNRSTSPPSIADKPASSNLTTVRKFGDVDTSSAKNMFTSLRSSTAKKSETHAPPPAPAAFAVKHTFAPPPKRAPSATSESSSADPIRGTPPPALPRRAITPEEPEEEAQGEWAEALYDYSSGEPGDLEIRAKQQVLVTERTSDDWWTGEVDGKSGLFPASYVKIL